MKNSVKKDIFFFQRSWQKGWERSSLRTWPSNSQQLHTCHNSLKLENLRLPLCYYIGTYYNIVYIHTSFHKFPNILGQKYVKTSRLFYGVDPERLEEKRDFSTDFFFTRHKYELCICILYACMYTVHHIVLQYLKKCNLGEVALIAWCLKG